MKEHTYPARSHSTPKPQNPYTSKKYRIILVSISFYLLFLESICIVHSLTFSEIFIHLSPLASSELSHKLFHVPRILIDNHLLFELVLEEHGLIDASSDIFVLNNSEVLVDQILHALEIGAGKAEVSIEKDTVIFQNVANGFKEIF